MGEDGPQRIVRHDIPPGYTGPTRWTKHIERMTDSQYVATFILSNRPADPNEPTHEFEVWTEVPVDPDQGPLAGQGRDWESEAKGWYWRLRGPEGPIPTQSALAAKLDTSDRNLLRVLGPWRAFVKRAEASPPG